MAKREAKCEDCPALPAWVMTYGDMMSLLLTFFILLLSFSSIHEQEFKKALGALQGALGVLDGEPILTSPIKMETPLLKGELQEPRPSMKEAKEQIEKEIQQDQQQKNVEVVETGEGIIIRISDRAAFDSGDARIKPEFLPLLNRIGGVLARMPNPVEIEGHTDDVPISSAQYPNNHWLSSARSLGVLDVFAHEVGIAPQRLSAVGYGEFRPLVANDTAENRARNRRVEIKIRHMKGEGGQGASPDNVRRLLEEAQLGVE
ncbi:MAG: flagellar motor protein MotB [Candidatus Latescibacterota bacterium]